VDPIISESINWEDWVRSAFWHTLPSDFEDHAIAWEQYQQALLLRLPGWPGTRIIRVAKGSSISGMRKLSLPSVVSAQVMSRAFCATLTSYKN
jgi:hypothetical protein